MLTPWYAYHPLIHFSTYYNTHPVVLTQRRTWQVATHLNLDCIRFVEKQEPWVRWNRRTLANTLRAYRSRRHEE